MNHESLTPIQQTGYDNAETLAWQANEAFDRRYVAATQMAETSIVASIEEFQTADKDFKTAKAGAETLMPPYAAFEIAESIEPCASEAVWAAMSPEQQVKASELRKAIASSELKKYGVSEESLRVVMITEENDGFKSFHLIHTGNGVDIGNPKKEFDPARSYNSVMSSANDALFQVEVNGVKYDTRSGMTADVYDAKVADARQREVTLPDSKQLSDKTDDVWTWTMLTGEKLTADAVVRIRNVYGGQVRRGGCRPDRDDRYLRVCPAVEIQ